MTSIKILLERLLKACQRRPDMGGDLWSRGIEVIQRRRSVLIYLSKFQPTDVQANEAPEMTITITGDY